VSVSTYSSILYRNTRFSVGDRVHWRKGSKHGKGVIVKIRQQQTTWARTVFEVKTDAGTSIEVYAHSCVRMQTQPLPSSTKA
jgi:putative ribosome biogenesis GTPase RsgA